MSAPGLSWDAMLKMKKIKLELITDPDRYIFFEKCTRGRISYISNRYSKASNKYLQPYDLKQESKQIYLDVNNLHGYKMSKFLATSRFKWMDPKEFDLNKYTNNSSKGCALEVQTQKYCLIFDTVSLQCQFVLLILCLMKNIQVFFW